MVDLLKKLNIIQFELEAPKNQYNSFGKYKYRSCEDILEGLQPLLSKHGCVVTLSDSIKAVGDRIYVEATATIYDCESGQELSNTASAREADQKKGMDSSQVTGATSSYARKYALNGLFAIDDEKDADTRDNSQSGQQQPEDNKEWLNDVQGFICWAKENGYDADTALKQARSQYKVSKKAAEDISNGVSQ